MGKEVQTGGVRADSCYRLHVTPHKLPPLRDRSDDIPLLTEHFVSKFNTRLGTQIHEVTPAAMAALMAHSWPGNIRELENLIERSVLLCEGDRITLADLPGLVEDGALDLGGIDEPPSEMGLKQYVRVYTAKLERNRNQRVLEEEGGNVTHASKKLGISRKSLQLKMKEYGLREPARPREPEAPQDA